MAVPVMFGDAWSVAGHKSPQREQGRFVVLQSLAEHDRCTLCLQERITEVRRKAEAGEGESGWFVHEVSAAAEEDYPTAEANRTAMRKAAEKMIC